MKSARSNVYPPWCSSGRRRLRNPLGTAQPIDVTILPNPDPNVNPYYSSYDYMGGGPVYKVPDGMPGSGNLLMVYHAEIPTVTTQSFYSVLALAKSTDDGKSWTDLGEIIRINQAYRKDLDSRNSPFCHLSNASSSGDGSCTTPFFPSTSTRLPPGRGMRPSIGSS